MNEAYLMGAKRKLGLDVRSAASRKMNRLNFLKLTGAGLAGATLLGVAGCGGGAGDSGSEQVELNVAMVFDETHPGTLALEDMAQEAEDLSEGSIGINVLSGGAAGDEIDTYQQVQAGSLDMALIQGISLFQGIDSRLAVEEIPFLWQSPEEAYAAVDGEFGDAVTEILEESNMVVLAYWENGFRHFTNNVRPIVEPEDMRGITFRSAESEIRLQMFNALGADAQPMAFPEVYTGLQQGTIDGQENPLATIESSNFPEVQEYLSLSGHIWNSSVLIVNPGMWENLSEEQQEILQELSYKYREQTRADIIEQDEQLVEEFESQGMEINEINVEAFEEAVSGVVDSYVEENGDELLRLAQQQQ